MRTLGPGDQVARRAARPRLIASPDELARAVAAALGRAGFRACLLPGTTDDVDAIAVELVRLARYAPRRSAFVRAAEPGVAVPARARAGRGGRAAHIAALVGRDLAALPALSGDRRVLFAAIATDGVDGASGTGGAFVDERFAARVRSRLGPQALQAAIGGFDTGTLHRAMGSALPGRPTGHNLGDLHVLLIRKA
jgi:hydroxypyruvate reductase